MTEPPIDSPASGSVRSEQGQLAGDAARFQLFTGKGGVGKSTLVAALAVEAAAAGRRPLVVELGHRTSMQSIFGVDELGYDLRRLCQGVWGMKMEFERSVVDYFEQHVPVKRVSKAIAENPVLQRFFRAAPAVAEIATLAKLQRLVEARTTSGPTWDPVLVDMDATGHALMLLDLPRVMHELVGDGPLSKLVSGFSKLLRDETLTRLNLVTMPRELPVSETKELYAKLEGAFAVPLGRLYVNRVPRSPLDGPQLAALAELDVDDPQLQASPRLRQDLHLAERELQSCAQAHAQLESLRAAIPLPTRVVPAMRTEPSMISRDDAARQALLELGQIAAGRQAFAAGLDEAARYFESRKSNSSTGPERWEAACQS